MELIHPFLPYYDDKRLVQRLTEELAGMGVRASEVNTAVAAARAEDEAFKEDIRKKADEIIDYIEQNDKNAIILAGRPYHLDPEINHGIDQVISSFGFAVLTESSVAHRDHMQPADPRAGSVDVPLRDCIGLLISRERRDDIDLIQLNSFGCGLDAVTTDQVEEITVGAQ